MPPGAGMTFLLCKMGGMCMQPAFNPTVPQPQPALGIEHQNEFVKLIKRVAVVDVL